MVRFKAQVVLEGASKRGDTRNRRVSIPAAIVRALEAQGCAIPAWLEVQAHGFPTCVVRARKGGFALPDWCFGKLPAGRVLAFAVRPATECGALATPAPFDWAAYALPEDHFVTECHRQLTIYYRREPFTLLRCPPEALVYWLLGLYQAEGSKKAGNEWSLVSSNCGIIQATVDALTAMGVPRTRMNMSVLHHPKDDPAAARAEFESIGLRVVSVLPRTPHKKWKSSGSRGCVLRVEQSLPFYRLTMAALEKVFAEGFPTKEAARAFALGWLEGDGGLHINKSVTELRLHGSREECTVVLSALHYAFGWGAKGAPRTDDVYTVGRSLNLTEALALAEAGAFRFSMNRVRLLYGSFAKLRALQTLHALWGARVFRYAEMPTEIARGIGNLTGRHHLIRHGGGFALSQAALDLCAIAARLEPEMKTLQQLSPLEGLGKTGVKCAPYPVK